MLISHSITVLNVHFIMLKRHQLLHASAEINKKLQVIILIATVLINQLIVHLFSEEEKPIVPITHEPTLTFCICPYPVSSELIRNRYFVTMSSLLKTSPHTTVLILMEEKEFDPDMRLLPILRKIFGKKRILFGPSLETDEKNIPYIDDWFIKGLDYTTSDLVCWINADIITPSAWYPRISALYNFFKNEDKQFAVVSRRCDFNISTRKLSDIFENSSSIYMNSSFKRRKKSQFNLNYDEVASGRQTHTTWGMDFFLISRTPMEINFDDIPPFHMGRYRWDPWIVGWFNNFISLISLGDEFCTYHMNHKPTIRSMNRPKVKENFEVASRNGNYIGSNEMAAYQIKNFSIYYKNRIVGKLPPEVPHGNAPIEIK